MQIGYKLAQGTSDADRALVQYYGAFGAPETLAGAELDQAARTPTDYGDERSGEGLRCVTRYIYP